MNSYPEWLEQWAENWKIVHCLGDEQTPYHVNLIDTNQCVAKFATYEEARSYGRQEAA